MKPAFQHRGLRGSAEQEGGRLHGRVLGVRDVLAYEGRTMDELRRHFERVVNEYLLPVHTAGAPPAKAGMTPPRPARGRPKGSCTLPPEKRCSAVIRARVTEADRAEYERLGGKAWLLQQLAVARLREVRRELLDIRDLL